MSQTLTSYTCKLDVELARKLSQLLEERGWDFYAVPHSSFAARSLSANVVYYDSGKLVVQGKGTREFVEFVLEPEILGRAGIGYETILNPDLLLPRIGVDESGKGDFFGPLCIAGVYVNEKIIEAWREAGIQDSKNISSDKRIAALAELIRNTRGCVTSTVPIGNEAYNRLYQKMGSVNKVLAWGHARVIENLMACRDRLNPPPARVISDQFAHDKKVITGALMALGREVELIQRHKAEADPAVAAASILARHEFVTRLEKLGRQFEVEFPKGASGKVDEAARAFVGKYGAEKLSAVAKVHFRTAFRAQGLPEPARTEWRKKSGS